ncbi:cysteine proteinase inhibitor 5-like [Silene latifolia]|uniref:cysteine proteinase inhibitor 5-like n=1 Tax=Silene latifolia TaxID=37657 RepID=UPI003D780998
MKAPSSIILLSFVLVIFLSCASSIDAIVGGWKPVKSVIDPHLVDIARFAVLENNKKIGKSLELVKINKSEYQVVNGFQYRLIVDAKTEGKTKSYQATVVESGKKLELISFIALLRITPSYSR